MTTQIPTLGVIVPTIGDRPELKRLLLSVLSQSRPVQAICVVVDARETTLVDGILEEIRDQLGSTHMEVISTGADRSEGAYLVETGYGFAVNRGLETLDTELVAFLDDDDEIRPSHFAQLEAALDPAAGKGAAYCRVLVVSRDGKTRLFQQGNLPQGKIRAAVLIGSHPVLLPATLIHRSVLDEVVGLDETLDRKADTDMVVRLGHATEFVGVDDPTYVYHRTSHGSVVHDRALTEMTQLLRKHQDLMNNRERWIAWDALARSSLRSDLPEVAREAAKQAIAVFWSNPPGFVVSLYLWVRGLRTPQFVKRLAIKGPGKAQ